MDPGVYQNKKTDIFWVTQRRAVPTAFRLFTGLSFLLLLNLLFVTVVANLDHRRSITAISEVSYKQVSIQVSSLLQK